MFVDSRDVESKLMRLEFSESSYVITHSNRSYQYGNHKKSGFSSALENFNLKLTYSHHRKQLKSSKLLTFIVAPYVMESIYCSLTNKRNFY